jgi:hypothetical protein
MNGKWSLIGDRGMYRGMYGEKDYFKPKRGMTVCVVLMAFHRPTTGDKSQMK